MSKVVIAIPTFRRPLGLAQLLESLAALVTVHDVQVIVADNDAEGRDGTRLANGLVQSGYRWPVEAIVVPAFFLVTAV